MRKAHNKLTQEQFLERARLKHGDKYDYSLVKYVDSKTKIDIICPKHGVWSQAANAHINRGDKCPKCALDKKSERNRTPKEEFIRKSSEIHNNRYDYSLVHDYKRLDEKLTIICPIHGNFQQVGSSHLSGHECNKCSYVKRGVDYRNSKEDVLALLESFNNGLIYNLDNYTHSNSLIEFTCPVHGVIRQQADKHIRIKRCGRCSKGKWRLGTTEAFIEKAIKTHGDYYDYSLVKYVGNATNVDIVCKYHGVFSQRPNTHIEGKAGCPTCAIITSNIRDNMGVEEAKSISCDLYILHLKSDKEEFYKIGISRYITKRINGINYDANQVYSINLVESLSTTLFIAASLEQQLHKDFRKYKYRTKEYFKGHTECFTLDLPVAEIKSNYLTNPLSYGN